MRVIEAINQGLHTLMQREPELIFLGEDVLDPYGGAFKASKGLSTEHPDRVWTMPISEGAMVGVATGLALGGKPAIVEIMFGDFLTLAADQLVNHAAKFRWMYDEQVEVPLVVRTPMGGGRGYGPTHSQSLEKHFCGVPGLTVLAAHEYADPGALLCRALGARSPHLVIENKVMYARPLLGLRDLPRPVHPDLAIIAYGGSVALAAAAARRLAEEEEIAALVLPVEQLHPFPAEEVRLAVGDCERVLVVEEGSPGWGFAGECARALIGKVRHFRTLSAPDHPLPASRAWEDAVLPDAHAVRQAALDLFEAE